MARSVSVNLEADVAGFLGPVLESARATEKLDDKVDALDRSLDKIPADALKAAAAVKALGDGVKFAGDKLGTIPDKAAGLSVLDAKIRESRLEVKKLTEEFIKTGDIDVFRKLTEATGNQRNLSNLRTKLVKDLKEGVEEGAKVAASTFSSVFQGGIIEGFKSLPGEVKLALIGTLVGIAVVAAPAIGAVVTSALLLGIGAAGIGAGIAIAASDPGVQRAFEKLKTDIGARLKEAAAPFRGELLTVADKFGNSFDRISGRLDGIFSKLAAKLGPLADGLTKMVENALPGIDSAIEAAGPILDALADNLPQLGNALSEFFESLSEGGEGAKAAFQFMLVSVEALIVAAGWVFEWFSKIFEKADQIGHTVRGWFTDDAPEAYARKLGVSADATKDMGDAAALAKDDVDGLKVKLNLAGEAGSAMAGKVKEVFDILMNLDQATLGWYESLTKLGESLDKNGHSINIHKKAGQQNREAILQVVSANMQLYQSNIASGMSAEDASKMYDQNTASLEKQLKQAGYTKAEIAELIGKYKGVPGKVNTIISIDNLTQAINDLSALIKMINHIPDGHFNIYGAYIGPHTGTTSGGGKESGDRYSGGGGGGSKVNTSGKEYRALGGIRYEHGGIRTAADGFIVPPSDPGSVLFGEPQTGGELYLPMRGITQSRAMGLMQTAGAGYGLNVSANGGGRPVVNVSVSIQPGSGSGAAVANMLLDLQRIGQFPIVVSTS